MKGLSNQERRSHGATPIRFSQEIVVGETMVEKPKVVL